MNLIVGHFVKLIEVNVRKIMHYGNYQTRCSGPQPQPTVKHMQVPPEQMDPRLIERAARELQMMQQAPMSSNDGVNITVSVNEQPIIGIGVTPASEQHAQEFSRSGLGQQLSTSMELAPSAEAGDYVKKRSADILSQALMHAQDPNMFGGGYYDIGKHYRPQG